MFTALTVRILALDAAGHCCGAALLYGERCLGERSGGNSRAATAALPGIVKDLLAEHRGGFDAVGVTVGPGSFTGLRGALAIAHGLALGVAVPVVGVRVAEALLHGVAHDGPVWVALDARRTGRIYLDTGSGMALCRVDALPVPPGDALVVGDAAAVLGAVPPGGIPQAVAVADVGRVALRRLAGEIGCCSAQPLYIEASAAWA